MRRKILKKKYKNLCKLLLGGAAFLGSMFTGTDTANALPVEPATINRENIQAIVNAGGGVMNITGTGNAFISWRDFSISPNEIVNFSGMTNMLNYVSGVNPSLIYGTINAPTVKDFYVINPSGVLFGPNSQVITNNLYVSTRSLTDSEISKYVSNGTNPLDTSIDVSRINEGGLKSSDIIGAYDIADGDVMFLGKVQANNIKIEGNTIQIRNTQNFRTLTSDGEVPDSETSDKIYNWDDAPLLTGDKVKFFSNNPVEVGYDVNVENEDITTTIDNPFPFDSSMSDDDLVDALLEYYGLYKYDENEATYKYLNGTKVLLDEENRKTYGATNAASLENLCQFYKSKISEASTKNEKIIVAMALDNIIRQNIEQKKVKIYPDNVGIVSSFTYGDVSVLNFPASTADEYAAISSAFDTKLAALKTTYGTMTSSNTYRYYVADMVGDKNMPNSANNLGYVAKKLNQTTSQTIEDYRLINSAYDLNLANQSKFIDTLQLSEGGIDFLNPTQGKIHGKYMLGSDIDLSGMNFKPLGYAMDYDDFSTEDDLLKFNGLNFTIKGLKTDTTASDAQGLFSVFAGTVKNVRLSEVNIDTAESSNSAVGGLIGGIVSGTGTKFETTLKNISVDGSINGDFYVGGLVGNAHYGEDRYTDEEGLSLEGPYADEVWDPETEEYVYGYYGYVYDEETGEGHSVLLPESYWTSTYQVYISPGDPKVVFDNVENFAPVTANSSYSGEAGGIAGKIVVDTSIKNSMNKGNIWGGNYAGGIFGQISDEVWSSDGEVTINKVANMGNVEVNGESWSGNAAGGIAGMSSDDTVILNSYNTGQVKGQKAGGIVGKGAKSFTNVFNSGAITAESEAAGLAPDTVNTIVDSYNSGSVTSEGSALGIAFSAQLKNVYNSGDITANGDYAFGLVSTLTTLSSNIYNVGNVTNNGDSGYAAGIARYALSGTISNVYNFGKITNKSENDGTNNYYSRNGISYVEVNSGYSADSINLKRGRTAGVI
ncbi:MAG: filamentous hemagglutinin N-terminal domain-containing protein, partial [Selenomonadaceae bacterium]|nr:filamentous hemagglutinin N-terminal domain-containing protein [Selenomonadaceae bacterium]